MEYASIYDLKSYVAFFISKFDKSETWERFWYVSQSAMIEDINSILDPDDLDNWYIKFRTGEFDVFFDNWKSRRTWRDPTKQVKDMYEMRNIISYDEMCSNVSIILNRWNETPLTVIYGTVSWWKIIDLRDIIEWSKTSISKSKWQELINEFWHVFLPRFQKVSNIYDWRSLNNIRNYDSWLSAKSWIPEIRYVFSVSWNHVRVELSSTKSKDKKYNKRVFDHFYVNKEEIEKKFWDKLIWERMDDKIMSRISYKLNWVNVYDKNDWDKIMDFLSKNMIKLDEALKEYIALFNK